MSLKSLRFHTVITPLPSVTPIRSLIKITRDIFEFALVESWNCDIFLVSCKSHKLQLSREITANVWSLIL